MGVPLRARIGTSRDMSNAPSLPLVGGEDRREVPLNRSPTGRCSSRRRRCSRRET